MEDLRHKMSALLMYTSEENPFKFKAPVVLEGNTQGLSDEEKTAVTSAFQDQEGIIWFNIEYCIEPIEFDDMIEEDLINIFDVMETQTLEDYYNDWYADEVINEQKESTYYEP